VLGVTERERSGERGAGFHAEREKRRGIVLLKGLL